jgi:hypothetical protein
MSNDTKPNSELLASAPETATTPESKVRQSRDHKRTTVRFTDAEFERLTEEAKLSGLSIPALLKKSHFGKRKLQLLLGEVERHFFCTEVRRISNNANQIAKRVNSGVFEGWYKEFQEIAKKISELHQMAAGAYGLR